MLSKDVPNTYAVIKTTILELFTSVAGILIVLYLPFKHTKDFGVVGTVLLLCFCVVCSIRSVVHGFLTVFMKQKSELYPLWVCSICATAMLCVVLMAEFIAIILDLLADHFVVPISGITVFVVFVGIVVFRIYCHLAMYSLIKPLFSKPNLMQTAPFYAYSLEHYTFKCCACIPSEIATTFCIILECMTFIGALFVCIMFSQYKCVVVLGICSAVFSLCSIMFGVFNVFLKMTRFTTAFVVSSFWATQMTYCMNLALFSDVCEHIYEDTLGDAAICKELDFVWEWNKSSVIWFTILFTFCVQVKDYCGYHANLRQSRLKQIKVCKMAQLKSKDNVIIDL